MTELAPILSKKGLSKTAKATIILAHLGGKASTRQIVTTGVANGARDIARWRVDKLFAQTTERVSRLPDGWFLLPVGKEYVAQQGYELSKAPEPEQRSPSPMAAAKAGKKVAFVGHGGSPVWREIKIFLESKLGLEVEEFNSISVVGLSNKERLKQMLDRADVALLVMTAEDEMADGEWQARMNVVHEVGLFQGRLGFEKAAVIVEQGCTEFSNIAGIGQIRFPKGDVSARYEQIRDWLSRESLI